MAGARDDDPGRPSPASTRAILISSSFTLHWAETSIKRGNRAGLRAASSARCCSARRSSSSRSTSTSTSASRRATRPGDDLLRPDRPARRARLHRPDPALDRDRPLVPRPLLARAAPRAQRAGHLLALRRHHVDRRVHDGLRDLERCFRLSAERAPLRRELGACRESVGGPAGLLSRWRAGGGARSAVLPASARGLCPRTSPRKRAGPGT